MQNSRKFRFGSAVAATVAAIMLSGAAHAEQVGAVDHSPLGDGDTQFRSLFSNWENIDKASQKGAVNYAKVAVPSRMPLDSAKLTSDFGMRTHPVTGGRRQHKGIDLASPTGTPIYATADGYVARADWFSSYGNYIQIEHGAELQTRFGHLSRIVVQQGAKVKKGDLIGYVGSTGRSTGPHLHYEVRVAGQAVNPVPYMQETSRAQAFALARGQGGQGGPQ